MGWKGGLPPRKMESLTPRRVIEAARAGANDGLGVDLVRDTDARLELIVLDVGILRGVVAAAEQVGDTRRWLRGSGPWPNPGSRCRG